MICHHLPRIGWELHVLKTMVIEIEKKKERDRERMTEND